MKTGNSNDCLFIINGNHFVFYTQVTCTAYSTRKITCNYMLRFWFCSYNCATTFLTVSVRLLRTINKTTRATQYMHHVQLTTSARNTVRYRIALLAICTVQIRIAYNHQKHHLHIQHNSVSFSHNVGFAFSTSTPNGPHP